MLKSRCSVGCRVWTVEKSRDSAQMVLELGLAIQEPAVSPWPFQDDS